VVLVDAPGAASAIGLVVKLPVEPPRPVTLKVTEGKLVDVEPVVVVSVMVYVAVQLRKVRLPADTVMVKSKMCRLAEPVRNEQSAEPLTVNAKSPRAPVLPPEVVTFTVDVNGGTAEGVPKVTVASPGSPVWLKLTEGSPVVEEPATRATLAV
jgi:hypothetical protein